MWQKKPADWPTDMPYCCPNNYLKTGQKQVKPSKEMLARIISGLIDIYEVNNSNIFMENNCLCLSNVK